MGNLQGTPITVNHSIVISIAALSLGLASLAAAAEQPKLGDATIRGEFSGSAILVRTTSRFAGAIDSLTWGGREFIDRADHGRQLQSAASFDLAAGCAFWAECFNPTEAGSRADGDGPTSSSELVSLKATAAELRTTTRLAFWLRPGEKSAGRPALNDAVLSRHVLTKRVRVGHGTLANVLDYRVTFTVPAGEKHTFAQFEALTGYMPPEFEVFRKFTAATGKLDDLNDGPGEQASPVVFATASGRHAMGVFSPDQPSPGYETAGYGRFRFPAEKVVKWNCAFRLRDPQGVPTGDHHFRLFVAVGTLEDVRLALVALDREFPRR